MKAPCYLQALKNASFVHFSLAESNISMVCRVEDKKRRDGRPKAALFSEASSEIAPAVYTSRAYLDLLSKNVKYFMVLAFFCFFSLLNHMNNVYINFLCCVYVVLVTCWLNISVFSV